jgi:hypothetical protein
MECFRWLYVSWRNHGHLGPRMPQNHGKTKKSTHFSFPLSSFYLDPLHGHGSFFLFNFSRFLPPCQYNNVSCSFFVSFLVSWCLGSGKKYLYILWLTLAQFSALHILNWCFHWSLTDFGYWAIRGNIQEKQLYDPPLQSLHETDVFFGMQRFWFFCL